MNRKEFKKYVEQQRWLERHVRSIRSKQRRAENRNKLASFGDLSMPSGVLTKDFQLAQKSIRRQKAMMARKKDQQRIRTIRSGQ